MKIQILAFKKFSIFFGKQIVIYFVPLKFKSNVRPFLDQNWAFDTVCNVRYDDKESNDVLDASPMD